MNESIPESIPDRVRQYIENRPSSRWAGRFWEGATAPWQGFRYLASQRSLWRYAIPPIILNLLITAAVLLILVVAAGWMIRVVHPWLTEGREGASWWFAVTLEIVISVALMAAVVILTVVVFKILSGVLVGYSYGLLAERIERSLGVPADQLQPISFGYELIDTVLGIALLMAVNIMLSSLNMIPIAGALLALTASMIFTLTVLGLDFLSYPLALRGIRRLNQFGFARKHHAHTVGLGTAVFGLQFIPVAGAIFLTTAVVGAVLIHRKVDEKRPPARVLPVEAKPLR